MKFTLTIELGNAEMMTGKNIADAIINVAHKVEDVEGDIEKADPYDRSGRIRDDNGNTVGTWEVS